MLATSNFLEQGRNIITPGLAASIGATLGLERRLVRRGAEVVLTLLALALARQAATSEGAAGLMQLLDTADETVLTDLTGYVGRFSPGDGEAQVRAVLGPGEPVVFANLRQATGSDLRSLTALLAPVSLAHLGMIVRGRQADAAGLARLLADEAERALASGSPAVRIAEAALAAGA
jgi:hypothetical protein